MEELAAYGSRPAPTGSDSLAPTHEMHGVLTGPEVAAAVDGNQEAASQRDGGDSEASDAGDDDDVGDSDELDDSGDEAFTPDSQASSEDEEPLTTESGDSDGNAEGAVDTEDISIYLKEHDLWGQVTSIIQKDACDNRCVDGKTKQLESFVCRPTFARCYGVVSLTVQRYKKHVRDGNIGVKAHGNTLNENAAAVDLVWLVKWFKEFAEEVGEVVPVRVRMQKTKGGVMKKYYNSELYTLLPAHFTWDAIYEEMHSHVEQIRLRVREPARSTMRKLLTLYCPTIRIQSPTSNVCDVCSIYHASMRNDVTAKKAEVLGRHTESARRMRREYKNDKAAVSDDHVVHVMDYSRNLTVPSTTSTPSQWNFCSLLAVNCFGIYYENDGTQTNYLYDETTSGKGSDQIISIPEHF
ncbi:hypothetical protein L916_06461 [Phytophthora nicotianae]|uniref:Uncharacterized protein n=1 Tax=Phytophthora nicotianae TaxID=4792 RepID=W2J8T8_PHYNI|nr:hypothetical protein L916_06461 [Phytophthora nicotianae]